MLFHIYCARGAARRGWALGGELAVENPSVYTHLTFFFSYAANNTDTTGFGVIVAIKVMIILIYN